MVAETRPTFGPQTRGVWLVCVAGAVRAFVIGAVGVLLAIYFAGNAQAPLAWGTVIGSGIAANALATLAAGRFADRWGRRRTQIVLADVTGAAYLAMAQSTNAIVLAVIALAGLVNGMGRDRGPASALDQAILPTLVSDQQRTSALAWVQRDARDDDGDAYGGTGGRPFHYWSSNAARGVGGAVIHRRHVKVIYDIVLYRSLGRVVPPEEASAT